MLITIPDVWWLHRFSSDILWLYRLWNPYLSCFIAQLAIILLQYGFLSGCSRWPIHKQWGRSLKVEEIRKPFIKTFLYKLGWQKSIRGWLFILCRPSFAFTRKKDCVARHGMVYGMILMNSISWYDLVRWDIVLKCAVRYEKVIRYNWILWRVILWHGLAWYEIVRYVIVWGGTV